MSLFHPVVAAVIAGLLYGAVYVFDQPTPIERDLAARDRFTPEQLARENEFYRSKVHYHLGSVSRDEMNRLVHAAPAAPAPAAPTPASAPPEEKVVRHPARPRKTSSAAVVTPDATPSTVVKPELPPENVPEEKAAAAPSTPEAPNGAPAPAPTAAKAEDPDDLTPRVLPQKEGPGLRERLKQKEFSTKDESAAPDGPDGL